MPRTRAEVGTFGGWRQCPEFVKFFIRGDRDEPLWPSCALHRSIQPLAPENVLLHLSSCASTTSLQNFLLCSCLPLAVEVSQWNEKLIPIIALKSCHLSFPFCVVLKQKKNRRTCRSKSRVADVSCNYFSPPLFCLSSFRARPVFKCPLDNPYNLVCPSLNMSAEIGSNRLGLAFERISKNKFRLSCVAFQLPAKKNIPEKNHTLEFLAIIELSCLRFLLIKCWSTSPNSQKEVSRKRGVSGNKLIWILCLSGMTCINNFSC